MKRKLALFLVLAMLISLVPTGVFAASDNEISKTPSISSNTTYTTQSPTPMLRIEESSSGLFVTETFQLVLENAEWNDYASFEAEMKAAIEASEVNTTLTATVERTSDSKLDVEIAIQGTTAGELAAFSIPMATNFDDDGAAKVTVKALDSALSGGTYTFATVADGSTTTTIEDTTTFGEAVTLIEDITIEENSIGTFEDTDSLGNNVSKFFFLKLTNNDFSWDLGADAGNDYAEVSFSGGFDGVADATVTATENNILRIEVLDLYDDATGATKRGSMTITGLNVDPGDASYGDVKVKVYDEDDEMTEETIVVGTYADYAVTAEADDEEEDLPVIYSGQYDEDEDNEISTLIIEETVADSWNTERTTTIAFPDWVHVIDATSGDDTENIDNLVIDFDKDSNEVEITGDWDGSGEITVALDLMVSVKADKAGDIVAKISGRGLPSDLSAKLGIAKLPLEVTTQAVDVKIGTQDQPLGKITLTEASDGILEDDAVIVLPIGDEDDFSVDGDIKVTVTKGDLEIDKVETTNNTIEITIDSESSEPSTIEITGAVVTLDRTVAEGPFDISVEGSFIKNSLNGDYNFNTTDYDEESDAADAGYAYFDQEDCYSATFAKVVTPAPGDTTTVEKVVFTIGSAEYMVGANKVTADVAPYINEQGRTMLPLRALANALGVADANIMWNEVERSVTIFKGDATIKVVIGDSFFVKNGVAVPMDTTAVIMNGRTMLPLRAIGQALGATVTWDEATRTVTVE